MAAPSAQQALVHLAIEALRRLAGAPAVSQSARRAAQEIEEAWRRVPWSAALSGADADRAAFVDLVAGEPLFAGLARPAGAPTVVLVRGPSTRLAARLVDGLVEEVALVGPADDENASQAASLRARRDELRAETAAREVAHERAMLALPTPLRERPGRWAILRWIARGVLSVLLRRKRAAEVEARAELDRSRLLLEAAEKESMMLARLSGESRGRFARRLRELASRQEAERITIELANGPLPEGVSVIDAPGNTASAAREADVLVAVRDGEVHIGRPDGDPRVAGTISEAIKGLAAACADARVLRLCTRARQELRAGGSTLATAIDRAEAGYQARLGELEALRVTDAQAFTAAELEKARPGVIERVYRVTRQTSAEVGAQLDQISDGWKALISAAEGTDGLREAAARIDEESLEQLKAVRDHAQRLVTSALKGGAHDLAPELLAELRRRSATALKSPPPPALPAIDLMPSLGRDDGGLKLGSAGWFAALFRSFDALKAGALERLSERTDGMRNMAMSELLDAEPRMRDALEAALALSLASAVDRHHVWLASVLTAESQAIAREREALAPLAELRDGAHRDEQRLAQEIAALEG